MMETNARRRIAMAWVMLLPGALAWSAEPGSQDSPALAKAKALFRDAAKEARDRLLTSFDTAPKRITESKWTPDEQERVAKAVVAEKARFLSDGLAPWSAPMRLSYATYRKRMEIAETALRRAFEVDIKKAIREKAVERVAELNNEQAALMPDLPIAYWTHLAHNNPPVVIAMFADGSFTDRSAHRVCQWIVVNDRLTLKWPHGGPGQFLLDSCDIALDGSVYEGRNAANDRISGTYHLVLR